MLPPKIARIIRTYLQAKDEQRPHLMGRAFAEDASFTSRFEFETDFSDETPRRGLAAITDTFRELGARCENIFTVCTTDSAGRTDDAWTCRWLVTMTERDGGLVRVAWGDYRWIIDDDAERARELVVTMVEMQMLEARHAAEICGWMADLGGPWVDGATLVERMPRLEALTGAASYLGPASDA